MTRPTKTILDEIKQLEDAAKTVQGEHVSAARRAELLVRFQSLIPRLRSALEVAEAALDYFHAWELDACNPDAVAGSALKEINSILNGEQ